MSMKKLIIFLCVVIVCLSGWAQEPELTEAEKLEQRVATLETTTTAQGKLKVSGYIQTQFQWGEEAASLKVGAANSNPKESFSRLGIRRGRIKFTYDVSPLLSGVFQLDVTEKGVGFKDAYLNLKAPRFNTLQLRAGVFDRPFGNEISYSSSKRESPERSQIFQTLFPDERDLGAMIVLQAPKTSPWNIVKLEAGLFAGNGIKAETDNRRDFIGHLSVDKKWQDIQLAGGVSYYNGGVYQGSTKVYTMQGSGFVESDSEGNQGRFARREYFGLDFQFSAFTRAGMTQLRAEYLWGRQPGTAGSSKSPNAATLPTTDTYIRPFSGWYAILVQDFGTLPFSAVLKYDSYDPNSAVKGNQAGATQNTSKTDLAYNTFGAGVLWRVSGAVRLQAFYEIVRNETSQNIAGFTSDRRDNLFTLRLQYKF
jgi:phosphate-selective porin